MHFRFLTQSTEAVPIDCNSSKFNRDIKKDILLTPLLRYKQVIESQSYRNAATQKTCTTPADINKNQYR